MSQIVKGSMEFFSTLETVSATEGLDTASKNILKHKEVLALIAKETIEEYQGYSLKEIMDFIEMDSITSQEASRNRSNTIILGEPTEFNDLNEKTSFFDVKFKARNPRLSSKKVFVNLHIDIEPQKDYRPGYPIEKRGIYYLARSLGSQLNLLTEQTDYSQLEKCYSIWICRDRIPKSEQYSISFYQMRNTKNIGSCKPKEQDYDLLTLAIIRLGSKGYDNNTKDLFHFLTLLFYPHRPDFMKQIGKYIDFSQNLELLKEMKSMSGLGQSILEEGIEQGVDKINHLNQILKKDGRVEDLMKAIDDVDYQEKLLKEYGL